MEHKSNRMPIFTERFRELQGDRSNTEFAEFLEISRQTVGFYCNGDRLPDALMLKQIAKKCHVSTDWLLGLSKVRSPDVNLKWMCEKTGLSESSIENLVAQNKVKDSNGNRYIEIINDILQDYGFYYLLIEMYGAKNMRKQSQKLLSIVDEFLKNGIASGTDKRDLLDSDYFSYLVKLEKDEKYSRFQTIDMFTRLIDKILPLTDFDSIYKKYSLCDCLWDRLERHARETGDNDFADFIAGKGKYLDIK